MPNHVQNIIIFPSVVEAENVREFMKGAEENEEREFDFNKVIPMPAGLDIEAGSRGDHALRAYTEFKAKEAGGAKEANFSAGFDPEDWELGKQYYENIHAYGHANWYGWCCANWGTKWNAYDVSWGQDRVFFNTAWSAPMPVIEALSKAFPDMRIEHWFADEDYGYNCGHQTLEGGEVVSFEYPEEGSKEAYELALRLWDDDSMYYDEESGELRYTDDE